MSGFFSKAGAVGLDLAHHLAWVFLTEPFKRTSIILRCDPELVTQTRDQEEQAPLPGANAGLTVLADYERDLSEKRQDLSLLSNSTTLSSTCPSSSFPDMPLRGIRRTMMHIYRHEGLWAFWRGLALRVPYHLAEELLDRWAITMLTILLPNFKTVADMDIFDSDQHALPLAQRNPATWFATFLLANLGAGLVSTALVHPLVTLYVRYVSDRVGHKHRQNYRHTVAGVAAATSGEDGPSALSHSSGANQSSHGYRYHGLRDLVDQTLEGSCTHDDISCLHCRRSLSVHRLYAFLRPLYRGFWIHFTLVFFSRLFPILLQEFVHSVTRPSGVTATSSTSPSLSPSTAVVPPSSSGAPLDPSLSSSSPSSSILPAFTSVSELLIFAGGFVLVAIPLLAIAGSLMAAYYAPMTVAFRQMVGYADADADTGNNEEKSIPTSQIHATTANKTTRSQAWFSSSLSPSSSWVAFRKITRREGYRALLRGLGTEILGCFMAMTVLAWGFSTKETAA